MSADAPLGQNDIVLELRGRKIYRSVPQLQFDRGVEKHATDSHKTSTPIIQQVQALTGSQSPTKQLIRTRSLSATKLQDASKFLTPVKSAGYKTSSEASTSDDEVFEQKSQESVHSSQQAIGEHSKPKTVQINYSVGTAPQHKPPTPSDSSDSSEEALVSTSVSQLASKDSYLPIAISKSGAMTSEIARVPVSDSFIQPPLFYGKPTESAEDYLKIFNRYCDFRRLPAEQRAQLFALLLREGALHWVGTLDTTRVNDFDYLSEEFRNHYFKAAQLKYRDAADLFAAKQQQDETVQDFIVRVKRIAERLRVDDEMLNYAVISGLKTHVKTYVLQHDPRTLADTEKLARIIETCGASDPLQSAVLDSIKASSELAKQQTAQISKLMEKINQLTEAQQQSKEDKQNVAASSFARQDGVNRGDTIQGNSQRQFKQTPQRMQRQNYGRSQMGQAPRTFPTTVAQNRQSVCQRCGLNHSREQTCRALNVECYNCHKIGHLSRVCKSAKRTPQQTQH
jgi:hypothetical protein